MGAGIFANLAAGGSAVPPLSIAAAAGVATAFGRRLSYISERCGAGRVDADIVAELSVAGGGGVLH